ncbi:hypothetical protein [Flavobacterium myungsuense]|uniref:hypothetical protein n=1 Tax=Flavobacterium myungsuense TaxID=651823 RepID=UPI0036D356B6
MKKTDDLKPDKYHIAFTLIEKINICAFIILNKKGITRFCIIFVLLFVILEK